MEIWCGKSLFFSICGSNCFLFWIWILLFESYTNSTDMLLIWRIVMLLRLINFLLSIQRHACQKSRKTILFPFFFFMIFSGCVDSDTQCTHKQTSTFSFSILSHLSLYQHLNIYHLMTFYIKIFCVYFISLYFFFNERNKSYQPESGRM